MDVDISSVFGSYSTNDIRVNGRVGTSMKRAWVAQFGGEMTLGCGFTLVTADTVECMKGFYFTVYVCDTHTWGGDKLGILVWDICEYWNPALEIMDTVRTL